MKLRGHTLITDFKTGEVLFSQHNVITNFGKTRAAELLGGLDTNYISAMSIGDQGAPGASPSTPFIPLVTDTSLANELLRSTTLNPVIVGSNELKLTALFLTAPPITFSSSLHAINEVGLFCQDDLASTPAMFARNCFPSVPFEIGDREGVICTWSIVIA